MIRPVTCVCFLLACGSGLYLYQEKHRAQVLDRKIEKTVRATDALRDQTRMLTAEWMLLNDPERLRQLSQQYLPLKVVSPAQFTSLADLDSRLPPPRAKEPRPAEGVPIAEAAPVPEPSASVVAEEAPKPAAAPAPSSAKVAAASEPSREAEQKPAHTAPSASRPEPRIAENRPEPRVAEKPRPTEARRESRVAEARPERRSAEPRAPEPRHTVAAAEPPRPAPPRPAPSYVSFPAPQPMPPSSAPASGGSFLGMARSSLPPPMPVAPHPTPVNARQWYSN
jgi:hypothetical protein